MRARSILEPVMKSHSDLAADLVSKVKRRNTGDPTYRFQIAGILVFLAGVDKTLSIAIQLLYIAGKVEWSWMKPKEPVPGELSCGRGLTAKIYKLKELGLDLTELSWLVELRNFYVHGSTTNVGYTVSSVGKKRPPWVLRANCPSFSRWEPPLIAIEAKSLKKWAAVLINRTGKLIDSTEWEKRLRSLTREASRLPRNPEPEYSKLNTASVEEIHEMIENLNKRYIGEGLQLLLKPKAR